MRNSGPLANARALILCRAAWNCCRRPAHNPPLPPARAWMPRVPTPPERTLEELEPGRGPGFTHSEFPHELPSPSRNPLRHRLLRKDSRMMYVAEVIAQIEKI